MEKQPLLLLGPLMPYLTEELEKRYAIEKLYEETDALGFLQQNAERFRAAVTSTFTGLKADMIDLLPALEIVSSFGVGTDSLDIAYAETKGIKIANTPDVLNEDTANMAITLLLAATRDIVANDRFVREGRWARGETPPLAMGIEGKKIGLVGLGRIGSVIARKLTAFGCDVVYHTRNKKTRRLIPALQRFGRNGAQLFCLDRNFARRECNERRHFARGPAGAWLRGNLCQYRTRHRRR